tara:strand:- start:48 stop:707 length:660 start_codon:yes stop_codon:yes gene_type:complete
MKTILLTLMFLILIPNPQKIVGTYKIIDELSDDTLELKKNGNYIYKERGDSCWTWYDFEGKWEIADGNLILIDKREYEEETSSIKEIENEKPSNKIIVKVITIDNKPISDFALKLKSTDYRVKPQIDSTNQSGIAEFEKFDIVYNELDNSSLSFKYKVNESEISSNTVVWRNSDSIYLTLNYNPKIIKETLKHIFEIDKNELILTKSESLIEGKKYKKL